MSEPEVSQTFGSPPIKSSDLNSKFKYELAETMGSEKILHCLQCGTCTSDCPIARYSNNYRPRTLIHMAILGLKDHILNNDAIWLCATCFTCTDRCPQNIDVANVIRVFRNIAIENGCMHPIFKEQIKTLLETGYTYKIPDIRIKKRSEQGLPPLPTCNIENIQKILKNTKFIKQIQNTPGATTNDNQ
ncbi:MAG: 4Fe-4S dicluster domain-containing protein [Nitrososphaerota archaeon]|jgi:heterodisulfide reductase subunit C|nr:4Fe-4S dicluster domain-containing protein [Nitrososphaerota archaeon]